MNHCKDCVHWESVNDYQRNDYDTTESKDHAHRICALIGLAAEREQGEPVPKAFTQDASSYVADLWTAPDFGCVLFEAESEGSDG